jgi:histidinol-phosphate aminotransferase
MSLVRPDLIGLPSVVHGSVSAAELAAFGVAPSDVLDFSVNTNPLGVAPSVLEAIAHTNWTRYPGDDEPALREAIGRHAGVSSEHVVLGNGSVELIWLIALVCVRSGDAVAVARATFGEYARAARVAGAEVVDLQQIDHARLAFVCNPNNPDGSYLTSEKITHLAQRVNGVLAVDEAYASFAPERWNSAPLLDRGNVVVLRSMTKDHALPGLRLGYVLAPPALAHVLESVRPPWSVNAGALRAGLAALEPAAQAHLGRAHRVVQDARRVLIDGFQALGYSVRDSHANFVLVNVGDGAAFRRALLPLGLVVRDCASFGLPSFIRVACKQPAECRRLLSAVAETALATR